jgi:hypothetical protein
MMKLSSTAFALFVATASKAPVSADDDPYHIMCYKTGNFVPCWGGFYWGVDQADEYGDMCAYCNEYPGQPLVASAEADVTKSDALLDPGVNEWSCYPEGMAAECPPGYAVGGLCVSNWLGATPEWADYCDQPGYFAMQCIPSPITHVPLNFGQWLPPGGTNTYGNTFCPISASVLCGLCHSSNPADCHGSYYRAKCCKCHIAWKMGEKQRQFCPTNDSDGFLPTKSHGLSHFLVPSLLQ